MKVDMADRHKLVLRAVIHEYIDTAEPIGSRTIYRHWPLGLSPASIRNVMADLEEMGLLWQPHVSAGRVPTEKAFRFYVDSLLKVRKLQQREQERIRRHYLSTPLEPEEFLRRAALILSTLSDYMGMVVAPNVSLGGLKHLQFTKVSDTQILAILISNAGIVQHKLLAGTDGLTQDELDKASRYLNSELAGLSLIHMRQRILQQMQEEKVRFDVLLKRALELGEAALAELDKSDVYVEGRVKILNQPEFADAEKMRSIFSAFEEKSKLLKLLDKSLQAAGMSIYIGSENEIDEIKEFSLVASNYQMGSRVIGTLGVLGPTRMNYSRVIPVVDYVSELVSEFLEA